MPKALRFKKKPMLEELHGLSVNGAIFEEGNGYYVDNTIVMNIPKTFRFSTNLEVYPNDDGSFDLNVTQFLTRGPDIWEMEEAFSRIGFRDESTEQQLRVLCDELINRDLAVWVEI